MLQIAKKLVNGNANAGFQLDLPGKHRNFNAQMKNWLLSLLVVLGSAQAFGQQDYFIYLQADNRQPFYLRLNDKVYSSTESGYLILSRLSDSSYHFIIGFPANLYPEQHFTLPVNHKDAGYLVKNFGDKGWGLFNLQTLAVIMNSNPSPEKKSPELNVTRKNDAFSLLLANAVNDTAILYASPRPVAPAVASTKEKLSKDSVVPAPVQESKTDTALLAKTAPPPIDSTVVVKSTTAVKTDTLAAPANSVVKDSIARDTTALVQATAHTDSIPAAFNNTPAPPIAKINTLKVAELLTDTSYIAVYTDGTTEKSDTIRISIPLDKPGIQMAEAPRLGKTPVYNMPDTVGQKDSVQVATQQKNEAEQKPAPPVVKDSAKTTPLVIAPVPERVKQPAEQPKKDSAIVTVSSPAAADTLHAEVAAKPIIPNSDCKSLAWDSDIDKLRIKMLAAKTDDDKITLAKKLFKQKCLTVKQIKALNELFITDEGKYKWFDAAYPFASDSYNYAQLEELFKDSYYQGRFKALIRR